MIRHYIVSAFRHIAKSKGVFAGNVFGFTLNFIVVIFGLNYVLFETSYDRFHENGDRIYRVLMTIPEANYTFATASALLAPTLEETYPEVESAVRIYFVPNEAFGATPEELDESGAYGVAYADPGVFNVFSFEPVTQAAIAEFSRPNTAVISRAMANRFFGDEDPTGRLLYSNGLGTGAVEVIGVMDDVPRNSHLRPDAFVSFATVPDNMIGRGNDIAWGLQQFLNYVLLIDGSDETLQSFLDKLEDFPKRYVPGTRTDSYSLEPLSGIYFSPVSFWGQLNGDINYVYFAVAYLVLISFMTVANYVNINIAHLVRRVKEMGLRKSFGAGRTQVISQMIVETLMNCLVAGSVSILCALLLRANRLPILEDLSQSEISVEYIGSVGLAFLLIGIVSGIAPAVVFYRVNPVDMLANRVSGNWTANSLRKGLLFFQLAISMALLLLTSLLYNQVTYLTAKPLGYEKENKVVIPAPVSAGWHQRIAEGFNRSSRVVNTASTNGYPGSFPAVQVQHQIRGSDTRVQIGILTVGRNFLETLKIPLIYGRGFADDERRNTVLLNETAFNALGLDVEDVGTEQEIVGLVRVLGVVSDFHIWSLHQAVGPLMLSYSDDRLTHLIVDIEPSEQEAALHDLARTFAELMPDTRFEYFFLDEKLEELYNSDRQILDTLLLLALVAFALAVAGIYNYGVFFTLNRIREVAIRKIHGASTVDIVRMNVAAISRSVALSLVIALPVVYWVYGRWISQYAYRADVSPFLVALPVLAVYVLTCIMVTRETLKTAGMKPAEAIRNVQH